MKNLFYLTFAITLISSTAIAGMRCSTDSLGNRTCRDNYGQVVSRSSTDSMGNTVYKDRYGAVIGRSSTDSLGNTT